MNLSLQLQKKWESSLLKSGLAKHRARKAIILNAKIYMRSFEEAGHYVIEFRKLGVEIIFSDDSLNGDGSSAVVTRALKLALAEFDNLARINKAIKDHEVALREGRYTFQPPIGYMRDNTTKAGVHKINPETGPVLQQALIA